MHPRLGLPCPVELKKQVDFPEPRVRINTDPVNADALGWDESAAWGEMADYYRRFDAATRRP
jgi:UDP-glucose 4-epimerase